jgi:Heme/copper-type cytochrome/quinol oxidase, subunit 3
MAHSSTANKDHYFVPQPSAYPFVLTLGLFGIVAGFGAWLERRPDFGLASVYIGVALVLFIVFRWFRKVALESEAGDYNMQVDKTFRLGMSWFIFSEVMFFSAFFGALFYTHLISVPWLAGEGSKVFNAVLWPHFTSAWPSNGPGGIGGHFEAMYPWGLPALNTAILITSSFTITWAHHALKENKRNLTIAWMIVTVLLGVTFLGCQAHEYIGAYTDQNLTLHSGVYGATFFMMTGFHGLHVTLGTIVLIVITLRLIMGHFSPERHFGFEGGAWYWHFVDVVWILLFVFVYVF